MWASTMVWLNHPTARPTCSARIWVSVASEVEGDAESNVAAALGQVAIEAIVLDVEDKAVMAWRQLAGGGVARFPSGDNHAAAGRFGAQGVEDELDLVNFADLPVAGFVPVRVGKTAPIPAISGIEIAVFVGPSIPDFGVLSEVADVVFTGEIPKQFVEQGTPHNFFGGEEWETIGEINPVMCSEISDGFNAGAARFARAVVENQFD